MGNNDGSNHVRRSHNVSLMLYHVVCPAKYRREIFTQDVENTLTEICLGIQERYEIRYVEIGADEDHVHFLIQSVPTQRPDRIVKTTKGTTGRKLFERHPEIKTMLWGGNLWTSGYYINTVGHYGNEKAIAEYVKSQGKEYKQIYRGTLSLFPEEI